MKANLSLECIGFSTWQALRSVSRIERKLGVSDDPMPRTMPWVYKVCHGPSGYSWREYIYGKRDYSGSNSKGSRGVMENFVLEENELYRVGEKISWRSSREYWASVTPNGDIYELSDDEAEEWLNNI